MTTIRIVNADPAETDDIQAIINGHGFGVLADDGNGGLVAVSPDNLIAKDMGDVEQALLDDVGKHLGVSFQ
jgi:hypothetical protein